MPINIGRYGVKLPVLLKIFNKQEFVSMFEYRKVFNKLRKYLQSVACQV